MSRTHVDIPVVVDRDATAPLSVQVAEQLRAAVREGGLRAGERLPSSRGLAVTLGVSRTVVMEAYQQLFAEGWLDGRHGSGTYVAEVSPAPRAERARPSPESAWGGPAPLDLRPGVPWVGGIDRAAWRRAWRSAAVAPRPLRGDPRGLPELREALVDYLRRSRGVVCGPGQIVVTRGATHAFGLLAAALLRRGDRVGFEEPGYPAARARAGGLGVDVVPCRVDDHGLLVDGLPEDLRLVYTTPAHQYPLGERLPVRRRQALLGWARRSGALVVEDDYDSEFRYDVAPLPALYGLDPGAVAYLGTSSKALTPDMGVGWLVADTDVVERVVAARGALGDTTPMVPQEALRIFLEHGDLDRHVRRMRHEYARRRALVVEAFRDMAPPVRLRGDTAGLHVVLELPAALADRVVSAAAEHGVLVGNLDRHYIGAEDVHGLVLGYGGPGYAEVERGCAIIRRLLP